MTDETRKDETRRPPRRELLPLPGLAAISLYLLVLAGVIVLGVVGGRHYPPLFLVFSAAFIAASAGLLLLLRWAWAMALGAVFCWRATTCGSSPASVRGQRWCRGC
jgi:hypothetical protein